MRLSRWTKPNQQYAFGHFLRDTFNIHVSDVLFYNIDRNKNISLAKIKEELHKP